MMYQLSPYAWGWIVRIANVLALSWVLLNGWLLPDLGTFAVLGSIIAIGVVFAVPERRAKALGLNSCPSCGLNSSFKDGLDGYKPPIAILPLSRCSRCGESLTKPIKAYISQNVR